MTDDMTAIGTCRILWVLVQIITLVTGSGVGGQITQWKLKLPPYGVTCDLKMVRLF
jgi:hypothetical protein